MKISKLLNYILKLVSLNKKKYSKFTISFIKFWVANLNKNYEILSLEILKFKQDFPWFPQYLLKFLIQ